MRNAKRRGFPDISVAGQAILYFECRNILAACLDHVLTSAHEVGEAVVINAYEIAGGQPTIGTQSLGSQFRLAPIPLEYRGTTHLQFSGTALIVEHITLRIDQAVLNVPPQITDGSRVLRNLMCIAVLDGRDAGFGHAEAPTELRVGEYLAYQLLAPLAQRRCGRLHKGRTRELEIAELGKVSQAHPHRRQQKHVCRPMFKQRLHDGTGFESRYNMQTSARIQDGAVDHTKATDVKQWRGQERATIRVDPQLHDVVDRVRRQVAMRQHRALRCGGSAGRIHDDGNIVVLD